MSKTLVTALGLAFMVTGCAPRAQVIVKKDAPRVQRVLVMPFTDDPLSPGSGLKAASYFQKSAQFKMPNIQWIGPADVLKQQGVDVGTALDEDTVLDAPGAMEPVLGKILQSTATVAALNPANDLKMAQQQQADAVVRGAVYYDPGTGMIEGMVTKRRSAESGLAIQMVDAKSGQVFLAFRQPPKENDDHPTMSQLLRETAESAAQRIQGSWK